LSLFKDLKNCKGEITPAYAMLDENDVQRMSNLLGRKTKIIFLLRHPIERSWSSYKYTHKINNIDQLDRQHFEQFLNSKGHRRRSDYLKTISIYKKHFDSICIGFFDAISENPKDLLKAIFDYLGLDKKEIKKYFELTEKVNSSKAIEIPQTIRDLLYEFHHSNMLLLAEEYGEYFLKWIDHKSINKQLPLKSSLII
jgi:hypothetical protein